MVLVRWWCDGRPEGGAGAISSVVLEGHGLHAEVTGVAGLTHLPILTDELGQFSLKQNTTLFQSRKIG